MDPFTDARDLVLERFPDADWALLTGSVLGPGHRYGLTDLLDDHTHATDPGERLVIATALSTEAARAALPFAGRWVSGGKWLLRESREHDPALAARWLAARDDPSGFAAEVPARGGGPLFDGYRT